MHSATQICTNKLSKQACGHFFCCATEQITLLQQKIVHPKITNIIWEQQE